MDNNLKPIFFALIGIILGYLLFSKSKPEPKVITETKIETDTVYITIRDTIRLTRKEIQHRVIRDTIIRKSIQPQIKTFTASKPFLYGNTYVSGEVLGEVLKMDITNDFKLPQVTNTITTKETIIKKHRGLYIGAGVTTTLSPLAKLDFVNGNWIFTYQYGLEFGHSFGVGKRIF